MEDLLESALAELTDIQRRAVNWPAGPLLVLAGPGSGKTRVLTCRIARLLDSSRDQRFRVLALTFTNKAAHEMERRVTGLVPGLAERADIATFHGFCAQVLRQHGVHLGIKPDFAIYSQTADRRAVLDDAFRRDGVRDAADAGVVALKAIDDLKARLVPPEQAERHLVSLNGSVAEDAGRIAHAYRLYEDELRRTNALDFNSLILEASRLFAYPAMARHYRTVYRHWLIDEFQDTNGAQYALLRGMAGGDFRDLFAVADDDQTIFEWNGANVRRIGDLVRDFSCDVVQLPENFRCPPRIVEAANRLVVYNTVRAPAKHPAMPAPARAAGSDEGQIRYLEFETHADEVAGIADDIAGLDHEGRGGTAVLARSRFLLQEMHRALTAVGVSASIAVRRDEFVSPQMRWLVACLKQIDRPLDRRNMAVLVNTFEGFASPLDREALASRWETDDIGFLEAWTAAVRAAEMTESVTELVQGIADLAAGRSKLTVAVPRILELFERDATEDDDVKDDLNAWRRIWRELRATRGLRSLDRFLQELQLRPKEPTLAAGTVTLTTIHGAKGQEFDTVYLIGLVEGVLPSWQSVQKGDGSGALEEERRGCFVAITRTRRCLILSRARHYRGWPKDPSRFLTEMGCAGGGLPDNGGRCLR